MFHDFAAWIGTVFITLLMALLVLHLVLYLSTWPRDIAIRLGFKLRFRLGDRWQPNVKSTPAPLVLITGGLMGIGYEIALRYVKLGYRVHVWDVIADTPAGVDALKALRGSIPPGSPLNAANGVCAFRVDVTDDAQVEAAAKATLALSCPDILVLNAGIVNGRKIIDGEMQLDRVRKLLEVNVMHLYSVTHQFIPHMRRDMVQSEHRPWRRSIVVIGSVAGFAGTAFMSDYNASKAAANTFAEALAAELRFEQQGRGKDAVGVDVTLVCPYKIGTGMFAGTHEVTFLSELTPGYVADKVLDGVRHRKRLVVLPHVLLFYLAVKALLPWECVGLIDDLLGGSAAMSGFRGRQGSGEPSVASALR